MARKPTAEEQQNQIKEAADNWWLNLGDTTTIETINPLRTRVTDNYIMDVLRVMRNPEYFPLTCKILFNKDIFPFQHICLKEMWSRSFPMLIGSRGASKSFMLSLYIMLRLLFNQGCKVAVVGAGFRQAKVIYEYCENLWNSSPIYRDIAGGDNRSSCKAYPDRCVITVGDSKATFYPLGQGDKIRGERANFIICDEFSVMPVHIFETVVSGFGVVASSPVEKVKQIASMKYMKAQNLWTQENEFVSKSMQRGNQIIIAGTAYYAFNHFCKYWEKYCNIVRSQGDQDKLAEALGSLPDESFDWRDYAVIRLPMEMIPEGLMDAKYVSRARATTDPHIYQMEYNCVFSSDSTGFFRRTLIESCVTNSPIELPSGPVQFHAVLRGRPHKQYIYGIDPASERDNFAIIVLEINDDHRRIVYCWTTNRKTHRAQVEKGLVAEDNFYAFAARKIRNLMKTFPTEHIGIDSQGGGITIEEALRDKDKLEDGEHQLWQVIEEGKEKASDMKVGKHILHMVQFANPTWTADANHGLKKDMQDRVLLFPYFDPASLVIAAEDDESSGRNMDTLEDCVLEIEELKDELASITQSQTPAGRERWDTPDSGLDKSMRTMRKDRYSALLIANAIARKLVYTDPAIEYDTVGVGVGGMPKRTSGQLYKGDSVVTHKIGTGNCYGMTVKRLR